MNVVRLHSDIDAVQAAYEAFEAVRDEYTAMVADPSSTMHERCSKAIEVAKAHRAFSRLAERLP